MKLFPLRHIDIPVGPKSIFKQHMWQKCTCNTSVYVNFATVNVNFATA